MTAEDRIRDFVDTRVTALLTDWPSFCGTIEPPEATDEVEWLRDVTEAWLAGHVGEDLVELRKTRESLSKEASTLLWVLEEAHFRVGVLVGIELGKRLGCRR